MDGGGRPDSNRRSPPLQLDISGKLYLAPLTTVGGGYGGRLRGFLGIAGGWCPGFADF